MNVLSLFDGMSCGRIALDRAGIPVTHYYASELDKYAITVSQANWPETTQLGNVTRWREWDIDWSSIDLLIGGSPCQGFSFAGKQLAFDDPRSKLFFVYVDILNHIKSLNPYVKFLLENVKMKKEYLAVINDYLGVEPIFINSALVSAQNRPRFYWANWVFDAPEDKGIQLSDVLEPNVSLNNPEYLINERHWKGTSVEQHILQGNRQIAFTERRTEEAKLIRKEFREKYGKDFSPRRGKELTARTDGKMNCLTATYSIKEHTIIDEHLNYRKLTPQEWEILQTVPVGYTEHASERQRYKMLGNGWTVDVIAHILSHLPQATVKPSEPVMDVGAQLLLDFLAGHSEPTQSRKAA